jgi:hypothetical protein
MESLIKFKITLHKLKRMVRRQLSLDIDVHDPRWESHIYKVIKTNKKIYDLEKYIKLHESNV